jgi:hypothetical protein
LLTSPPNCEFGELVGWAPIFQRHLTKHNGMWLAHNIIHKKTWFSTMNKRTIHCKVWNECNIIRKIEHAIWFLKIFCKSLQVQLNQFSIPWFNNQNWIYCVIENNHSYYSCKNHCPHYSCHKSFLSITTIMIENTITMCEMTFTIMTTNVTSWPLWWIHLNQCCVIVVFSTNLQFQFWHFILFGIYLGVGWS